MKLILLMGYSLFSKSNKLLVLKIIAQILIFKVCKFIRKITNDKKTNHKSPELKCREHLITLH